MDKDKNKRICFFCRKYNNVDNMRCSTQYNVFRIYVCNDCYENRYKDRDNISGLDIIKEMGIYIYDRRTGEEL